MKAPTREQTQVALGLVTRGMSPSRAIAAALAMRRSWLSDAEDRVDVAIALYGKITARARSVELAAARQAIARPLPPITVIPPPPKRPIPTRAVVDPPAVRALMDAPRRPIGQDIRSRRDPWIRALALLLAMRRWCRAVGLEAFDQCIARSAADRVALRDAFRRRKGWRVTGR